MTRVIVHAGFHKTGTSSLQITLAENRAALAPWLAFHGQGDALHRSAVAARIYGQKPFAWRLRAFRRALRADLAALPEAETLVLSREHYSGAMPGHLRWDRRQIVSFVPAGRRLARVLVVELRRRFGPDTRVELLYTTRAAPDWLASVYGHLLRSRTLTDDYDTFAASLAGQDDLATQARAIAHAAGADALHVRPLEEADPRLGPAGFVLDLAGVPAGPRAALPPARRHNRGDDLALRAAFLDLNRSGRPKREIARAKALMRQQR